MIYYGKLGNKLEIFLGQNQLYRLQVVQFECPRFWNPYVSLTFQELPFPNFSPCSFLPSSLWGNKKWFILGGLGEKVEIFGDKISLTDCKWSSLNAPGSETPVSHPLYESTRRNKRERTCWYIHIDRAQSEWMRMRSSSYRVCHWFWIGYERRECWNALMIKLSGAGLGCLLHSAEVACQPNTPLCLSFFRIRQSFD